MSRTICRNIVFAASLFILSLPVFAGERPTLNVTCDPRPDILPSHWFNPVNEYRRVYNRPRYLTGKIAHTIAPSSQEAMVWCENYRAGVYSKKNAPPRYKRYFAPKPWEVLQTGARPDFTQPASRSSQVPSAPVDARKSDTESPINLADETTATPAKVPETPEAKSPSDGQAKQ